MTKKKRKPAVPNAWGYTEEKMYKLYSVKSSPVFWRNKAEELKYAAELLLPMAIKNSNTVEDLFENGEMDKISDLPPSIFAIIDGLLGYSLECLFKGCIIRDNPHFISEGMQNPQMQTHNLIKLAEMAKIILSEEEARVCAELTRAMYIDFRYPIDKEVTTVERNYEGFEKGIDNIINDLYDRIYPTINHFLDGKDNTVSLDQPADPSQDLKR